MSIDYRNQSIARVAFAVANADGEVAPSEREALERFLRRHPEVFDEFDVNDILAYFDNFRLHLNNYVRNTPTVDDYRIQNLTNYVYYEDLAPIARLLEVIAEADGQVVAVEDDIALRIGHFVSARLIEHGPEHAGLTDSTPFSDT